MMKLDHINQYRVRALVLGIGMLSAVITNPLTSFAAVTASTTTATTTDSATQMSATMVAVPAASIIAPPGLSLSVCFSVSGNLALGMRDSNTAGAITQLQTFLKGSDYIGVSPTGYFGTLTLAGVKQFQKSQGIIQTGFVGPLTQAAIKKITCGSDTTTPPGSGVPLTITSPKQNDLWLRGTVQNIVWSAFEPQTFAAGPIPPNHASYNIYLEPLILACEKNKPCPLLMQIKPYDVALNVSSNGVYHMSYPWPIGMTTEQGRTIPGGQYRIKICDIDGGSCTESDSFTITQ